MEYSASNINVEDFTNICRICLLHGDLFPLQESHVYSLFTNILSNVQSEMEDKLPGNICKDCLNDLEKISRFILKYKTSDNILRSVINQKTEKNVSINSGNGEDCRLNFYVKIEKCEISPSSNTLKYDVKEDVKCGIYQNDLKMLKNRNISLNVDLKGDVFHKLCESNTKVSVKEDDLNVHLKRWYKQNVTSVEQKDALKVGTRHRSFLCNICGKNFTRKSSLKIHIKIHTGEKNFACHICGFKFILKCSLRRHLSVHKKEKQFQCNICSKTLTQRVYLVSHLETFHSTHRETRVEKKEAPSVFCTVCGKGFLFKKSLTRHKKTHERRSFLCTQCGKQFTFKCNLDRHILITHSGEKPFECPICNDRFTCKTSLDCHLNIHNGIKPYQCASCQKYFRQPSSLRKHRLVHTGERRFKCHICEMAFKTGTHLKTHFKKHSRS